MSVTDPNVVDVIGVEVATGAVVLTISDHLDWEDPRRHELQLQDKLNTYLAFIESGEMVESYPDARGRAPVISVVMRVSPVESGELFLRKVEEAIRAAGIGFRSSVLENEARGRV